MTDKEEDITLDLIFLGAFNIEDIDASKYKSFGVLFRYLAIAQYYKGADSLERARFAFPNVNIRHVVVPKERLPSGRLPISFKPEELAEMITIGEKDAKD
jgi:hypothetical protein